MVEELVPSLVTAAPIISAYQDLLFSAKAEASTYEVRTIIVNIPESFIEIANSPSANAAKKQVKTLFNKDEKQEIITVVVSQDDDFLRSTSESLLEDQWDEFSAAPNFRLVC